MSWGLALVGTQSSGKVIAWVGMAMFAALAAGAPLGTALYAEGGFIAVAVATALAPLLALALVLPMPSVAPTPEHRIGMGPRGGRCLVAGIGRGVSSIGYGAILAFGSLQFAQRGWTPVWLAFTAYATALILARLFLGGLPDKLGGARIAIWFVVVEAAGLAIINDDL